MVSEKAVFPGLTPNPLFIDHLCKLFLEESMECRLLFAAEDIHFIWVSAHSDIPGNCKADELSTIGKKLNIWISQQKLVGLSRHFKLFTRRCKPFSYKSCHDTYYIL